YIRLFGVLFLQLSQQFAAVSSQEECCRKRWSEALRFAQPVVHNRGRRHHQRWKFLAALVVVNQQGQSLNGFPQTHVVCENSGKTVFTQERKPVTTLFLVFAQLAVEVFVDFHSL